MIKESRIMIDVMIGRYQGNGCIAGVRFVIIDCIAGMTGKALMGTEVHWLFDLCTQAGGSAV